MKKGVNKRGRERKKKVDNNQITTMTNALGNKRKIYGKLKKKYNQRRMGIEMGNATSMAEKLTL